MADDHLLRLGEGARLTTGTSGNDLFRFYQTVKRATPHVLRHVGVAGVASFLGKRNSNLTPDMPYKMRTKRPKSGYRRRSKAAFKRRAAKRRTRRRFMKRRRAPFSSKGFVLYDKEKFTLDNATPLEGYTASSSFWNGHTVPFWEVTGPGMGFPYSMGSITTGTRFFYFRFRTNLNTLNTASGMSEHFNRYKVNWLEYTFNLPGQDLETDTNTHFPVKMYVNYSDKYRVSFDANTNQGLTTSVGSGNTYITEMMERPGWKEIDIAQMKKIVIRFKPTTGIQWEEKASGADQDRYQIRTQPKRGFSIADSGRNADLLGPTVVFRGRTPAIAATEYQTAASIISSTPLLKYATVTCTAKLSFWDRNQNADD